MSYVPINGLLQRARDELQLGEMCQSPTFNLLEAMSAVELGHPKMDAAASGSCKSADELIAEGRAPVDGLSPAQLLLIMERLLMMEASWHNGAALAQTVYASLYMLRPERLQEACPLLYAYCVGLKETCLAVRWLVMNGAVAEEEDINCWVAGLPIEDIPAPPPTPRCLLVLDKATQTAKTLAKGAKGQDVETYKAIAGHLELRKDLHAALLGFNQKREDSILATSEHLISAQARVQQVMSASPGLQQQKQLQAKTEEQGAKEAKASTQQQEQQQEEGSAFDAPGFVENVNKYLLGPAPPRRAQTLNTEATFNYLKALLSHLLQATEVIHVKGYRALVQHVERFSKLRAGVVARSAAHYLIAGKAWGPGMANAVVAASQAAADLGPQAANGGSHPQPSNGSSAPQDAADSLPTPHWVLDRPMVAEACAMPDAPGAAGPDADMFLDQIVIASSNWTQAMLLNSCRQRRRLRRGLDDWANMYQHALNADMSEKFQEFTKRAQWNWKPPKDEASVEWYPGPLTTWVECQTAASEALHLLLGFELELYLPPEFVMIYWYSSVLLGVQKLTSQVQHSYCCPAGGASKSSLSLPARPGKKGKAGQGAALTPSAQEATALRQAGLVVDVMRAELMGGMCLGLVRLQLALKVSGIIPDPHLTFNTMRERFDQRFAAFHTPPLMRPEPMTYNQYLEAVADADKMAPEKLLALAMDSFAMVRQNHAQFLATIGSARPMMSKAVAPDQVAEYQAIDRIALANILACNILIKSLTSTSSPEQQPQQRPKPNVCITYNWSSHPFFPSLGVKSAPQGSKS